MTDGDALLIRVDASRTIGTGHLMRCLSLAEAWHDVGGSCTFAMAESLPAIDERLRGKGMGLAKVDAEAGSDEDAARTVGLAEGSSPAWVVLDGYRFSAGYQERIKAARVRLLVIDDYGHAGRYAADLILDQNLSARADLYRQRAARSRLLLGTRYVLLGHTFRARRPRLRTGPARHLLVTIGGVDPLNVTEKILRTLLNMRDPGIEVRAIVGSGNPNAERLEAAVGTSRDRIELVRDPPDMAELMDWADLAIAAAGTTAWELAYLGVPALLLSTAENQRELAASLAAAGAARDLGTQDTLTETKAADAIRELEESIRDREAMSQRGRALVDGQGVSRVVTEMRAGMITLRPVSDPDARQIWAWANDPAVRSVSFSSDPIPWETHVRWFAAKRADPTCRFYIGVDPQGTPLGQIRIDGPESGQEVSVSLDAKFRSRGYGSALILAASRKVLDESRVVRLHAYVKPGNEPSVRAFLKAGYRDAGRQVVRGHEALHFVLDRGDA